MKRTALFLLAAGAVYLAAGFYVVRGNERAALRLFGRAVRTPDGGLRLETGGLHYALPWPFSQIGRVNLNEIRTLSVGVTETDDVAAGGFLRSLETANQSQFLTGDQNILHLQINAQYHVSEQAADDFLFRSVAPEKELERIVASVATGLISQSGVDFVQPLGQVELNGLLTAGVRRLVDAQRLGLEIDDVAINAVYPPILVKAYFLDVTNARADKVNFINAANAYTEQRRAAATAEARRTLDEAASYRQQTVESARGRADSFTRLIEQFRDEERSGVQSYVEARRITLQRYYLETVREILKTVSAKVLLDSADPADLTIFSRPQGQKPPAAK
ncbi:MAG TPA: protease modulator HflK [Planctomycetaceae bacterium]|nr:protease modulator HflK [Planctomycetaceae bacterium]